MGGLVTGDMRPKRGGGTSSFLVLSAPGHKVISLLYHTLPAMKCYFNADPKALGQLAKTSEPSQNNPFLFLSWLLSGTIAEREG